MKKTIIIVGIISLFLFAGKIYASCFNNNEHCNYPNCTETKKHSHNNEINNQETKTYFHCEVEGCNNPELHTHETTTKTSTCTNCEQAKQNNNHNQNYSHHSKLNHHNNHHN